MIVRALDTAQVLFVANGTSHFDMLLKNRRSAHDAARCHVEALKKLDEQRATLERAIEKHRLTFLYLAEPWRRDPSRNGMFSERLDERASPDGHIPLEEVESTGEFLFKFKWWLDRVALTATEQFGTGKGHRPFILCSTGERIEVEGGTLPYWELDVTGCVHMEESSENLAIACRNLIQVDNSEQIQKLVNAVQSVMHDKDQSRWYPSNLVRWEYLSELEQVIKATRTFDLGNLSHEKAPLPNPQSSQRNVCARPDSACGGNDEMTFGVENELRLKEVKPCLDDGEAPRGTVFVSYSRADAKFLDQLLTHLKPLERAGRLTAWSDEQILPGSQWFDEIRRAIESARIAVLLVSPKFLASDFIHDNELGPILKKAKEGGIRIHWIPIRASSYRETALSDYQALCDPGKPLAEMKAERDSTWVQICNFIKSALSQTDSGNAGQVLPR